MRTWIKCNLVEYGPHDRRTGNPPGPKVPTSYIQPGGRRYPEIPSGLKVLSWQQMNPVLMLLVDGDEVDVAKLKAQTGEREVRLSARKVLRYNLSAHALAELDNTQALRELKETIGLPDGTTLGADGKPVIPSDEIS